LNLPGHTEHQGGILAITTIKEIGVEIPFVVSVTIESMGACSPARQLRQCGFTPACEALAFV